MATPLDESVLRAMESYGGSRSPVPSMPAQPDKSVGALLTLTSQFDPDQHAKDLAIAQDTGLPVPVVQSNRNEVMTAQEARRVDALRVKERNPKLYDYLTRYSDYAIVSRDDVRTLAGIEDSISANSYDTMSFLKDTAIDVALKGTVMLGQGAVGLADLFSFNQVGHVLEQVAGYRPEEAQQILSQYLSTRRQGADQYVAQGEGILDTLGRMAERPEAAVGMAAQNVWSMLAIGAGAAGWANRAMKAAGVDTASKAAVREFMARPETISRMASASAGAEGAYSAGVIQEQAREQGRSYLQTLPYALLAGTSTAAVSKIFSFLPGGDVEAAAARAAMGGAAARGAMGIARGVAGGAARVAGAGLREAGEEAVQSGPEAIFQNLAQGKPPMEGVGQQIATGMVAGLGMGLGAGAFTEIASTAGKTEREVQNVLQSVSDQQRIEELVSYAQQSTTAGRSPEAMKAFLAGLNAKTLWVPVEVAQQLPAEYLSDYLSEYAGDYSGETVGTTAPAAQSTRTDDIPIPLDLFVNKIARDPEALAAIRDHLKLNPMAMSRAELAAGESAGVRKLVEQAAKAQETKAEADTIMDQIGEQLRATGRLRPEEATYSSVLIPAYLTTVAERYRKLEAAGKLPEGKTAPTVRQLYEDFFDIKILGPQGAVRTQEEIDAAGRALNQVEIEIADRGTGETVRAEAPAALFTADSRVQALQQLLGCLRA